MKTKKIISRTAVIFMLLYYTSCANDSGTIRVLLDWTPNTNHTGLFTALEKGWFADEGLRVTITQPPEDEALVLVASGKAEFGVTFQESMGPAIAKERDALPVTAVAAIISHNTSGIMSLKESGIERPADLAGKRFASWETPVVTEVIRRVVERDGGVFSDVQMIPNNATDAFSALQTDVDAIWVYYAWDCIPAEIRNIDINFIDFGAIDSVLDFYTPVLVVNTNWAEDNRQIVTKFMNAVSKGYNYAINNPEEAADILLKHAPELDREIVLQSQKYLQTRYQGDAIRWGEIDPQRWGNFYSWMYESGLLEKDIGSGGFTNEFLP